MLIIFRFEYAATLFDDTLFTFPLFSPSAFSRHVFRDACLSRHAAHAVLRHYDYLLRFAALMRGADIAIAPRRIVAR